MARITQFEWLLRELAERPASDGCWLWPFSTNYGYGRLSFDDRPQRVHRLVFQIVHGDVPEGWVVCHSCANPRCFNPRHLFAGTQGMNNQDAFGKGRPPIKAKKLSAKDAAAIRQAVKTGKGANFHQLAERYGVSPQMIRRIVKDQSWRA